MRLKPYHFAFALVGLVLGILLSIQFKATSEANKTPHVQQVEYLTQVSARLKSEHDKKLELVTDMRAELDKLVEESELGSIREDLESVRIEAGLVEVTGPGLQITLNDSDTVAKPGENPNLYVLHDEDILRVLNELRAAGAEALAINNERVLSTSEIRCAGPTILINKNQRLTPPFVISAIGNQDNMISALKMRGGVVESLEFWGIQVHIKKVSEIRIPPTIGGVSFELAKPAGEVQ